MPQYKNKRTGKIVSVDEGVKMISIWEPLVMPEKQIPEESPSSPLTPGMQTFDTVVELKKSADKAFPAQTVRGSVYEYTDGQWVKISG